MNPYAAPASLPVEQATLAAGEYQPRPLRALARWTLICVMSAAPSFFWGCALHKQPHHIAGMICGILAFILVYTAIECTHYYHQIISRPHVRCAALIGYGTRVLMSVIFPVGLFVDMFTGVWSVAIAQSVFRASADVPDGSMAASFLQVFVATVIQGAFLNAMLLVYMLFIYSTLRVLTRIRRRRHSVTSEHALAS